MHLKPIIPFEPKSTDQIPQGNNWIAQVKWDGVRILTYFDGHEIRLFNRKLNERTKQFPEFLEINRFCTASSVILDGEIIAFDHGLPSFHEVMRRDSLRSVSSIQAMISEVPVTYMIFDLLYVNGQWVTNEPLKKRQELLNEIIKPTNDVQLVQNFEDGESLFHAIKEKGIEGIVCKDLTKSYVINGKDERWVKKKNFQDVIAIIGGASFRDGIINSLLLGLYDKKGQLWYIGHAGTGKLTSSDWRELTVKIQPLIINDNPFVNEPKRTKDTVWVKPKMTVKIQFVEWTKGFTLRQPSIQAFTETPIEECVLPSEMDEHI
jgi:bifunctional non-homologous end joining protein LigD